MTGFPPWSTSSSPWGPRPWPPERRVPRHPRRDRLAHADHRRRAACMSAGSPARRMSSTRRGRRYAHERRARRRACPRRRRGPPRVSSSRSACSPCSLSSNPSRWACSRFGCGLVVFGGLAFNLVPLCQPGRPRARPVEGGGGHRDHVRRHPAAGAGLGLALRPLSRRAASRLRPLLQPKRGRGLATLAASAHFQAVRRKNSTIK